MSNSMACLSPVRLRELAHEDLPPQRWTELEEHLTHCERCRWALDEFEGDPQWRNEVRSALSNGVLSDGVLSDGVLSDGVPADGSRPATAQVDEARPDAIAALRSVLALLGPTDDPRMLGRIGPYEIVGVLGRGGMGVVFKGFDGALNRYVAIKMLLPHLATSGAARKRFAREAQAAAAVVNDHVMAIHNVAEWQGMPYLVMPYGRGSSLQKRLNDEGPLEVAEVLRIGMQTAKGLAAAHAQGLVHRDVKPANILLDEGVERVTLTDFGLARAVDDISLTRVGMLAGTPQYMSPEQARGQSVDARSDLFSLGSIMYAMCTGQAPFRAESSYGVLRLITDSQPRCIREINADIPEWLERIVMKLLSKAAAERFASAGDVATLLEQCLAHVQQPTNVSLPDSMGGWELLPARSDTQKTGLASTGEMGSSKSARSTIRWIALAVAVLIAVSFVVFRQRSHSTSSGDAVHESVSEPSILDPLLDWNATRTELDAAARTIEQLETNSNQELEKARHAK
jgi:serine/threonine protein kinase